MVFEGLSFDEKIAGTSLKFLRDDFEEILHIALAFSSLTLKKNAS